MAGFTRPFFPELKFWAYVDRLGDDDCWEWLGSRRPQRAPYRYDYGGYGQLRLGDAKSPNELAHRIAWSLHNEREIPAGRVVRHRCDNPGCVNPRHLELGTQEENLADMVARGRWRSGQTVQRLGRVV